VTNPGTPTDDQHLLAAQVALEKEIMRADLSGPESEALREVLFGLRERNTQRVGLTWRDAFAEVRSPSENVRNAYDHLEKYFGKSAS
jgi:hypothetical protein